MMRLQTMIDDQVALNSKNEELRNKIKQLSDKLKDIMLKNHLNDLDIDTSDVEGLQNHIGKNAKYSLHLASRELSLKVVKITDRIKGTTEDISVSDYNIKYDVYKYLCEELSGV